MLLERALILQTPVPQNLRPFDLFIQGAREPLRTTNEMLLLFPVRKRVGMSHFAKSPLITACLTSNKAVTGSGGWLSAPDSWQMGTASLQRGPDLPGLGRVILDRAFILQTPVWGYTTEIHTPPPINVHGV